MKLQDARIKLGRAGVRSVGFSAGRMRVAPVELGPAGRAALKAELPDAVYESGRSTIAVPVPPDPEDRFPAVVAAAEGILRAATEIEDEPDEPEGPEEPSSSSS
jgi:transcription-repair coupling factor (superfamily II helicase)